MNHGLDPYRYDVLVVGAGHAGLEAALASSRLGLRTALLTINADAVGQMSCNPAIGGVAKGQIVREVDALGGAMGVLADASGIQFRLLNRGKGPAMHSPRAQCDKKAYQALAKLTVERQAGLTLRQEMVEDVVVEAGRVVGVRCRGGAEYQARAVVVTTGTFLRALMHTGEVKTAGGRAGDASAEGLSGSLRALGFELRRFKTGTPPRLNGRTIDFDRLDPQPGDADPSPFSFLTGRIEAPQIDCHITSTTPEVHDLIRANLHRAPMYSGQIEATGPRYCPSIEDKVVRFADRPGHQIFLEPEGRTTLEYYCNGISTSLPRDVQDAIIPRIPGLEHAEIMRYGYAVEYDLRPAHPARADPGNQRRPRPLLRRPDQRDHRLRGGRRPGADRRDQRRPSARGDAPFLVDRSQGYIGVLVDDLVTRGVDEPYRMFTSRAEYRLLLRSDNADLRLTPRGRAVGLVDDARWARFEARRDRIDPSAGRSGPTRVRRRQPGADPPPPADDLGRPRRPPPGAGRALRRPFGRRAGDDRGQVRRLHRPRRPRRSSGSGGSKTSPCRVARLPGDRPAPGRGPREVRPGPARLARPGRADQRDQPGRPGDPARPPEAPEVGRRVRARARGGLIRPGSVPTGSGKTLRPGSK